MRTLTMKKSKKQGNLFAFIGINLRPPSHCCGGQANRGKEQIEVKQSEKQGEKGVPCPVSPQENCR
ncbi:MAG: hypothetical protein GXO89_07930 [Chlorobi bacterium]|nr:hypothetical protein [Chlorobiota bacterium]